MHLTPSLFVRCCDTIENGIKNLPLIELSVETLADSGFAYELGRDGAWSEREA
jgi:hypothetical protein